MQANLKYLKIFVYTMGFVMMLGVAIISYAIINMNKNNFSFDKCNNVSFLSEFSDYEIIGLENKMMHVKLQDSVVTYNLCSGKPVREITLR